MRPLGGQRARALDRNVARLIGRVPSALTWLGPQLNKRLAFSGHPSPHLSGGRRQIDLEPGAARAWHMEPLITPQLAPLARGSLIGGANERQRAARRQARGGVQPDAFRVGPRPKWLP